MHLTPWFKHVIIVFIPISSFHIKFCFGSLDESVIGANFLEDIDWISEEPEAQAC